NLDELCLTCNEYGYKVFNNIEALIKAYIEDVNLQKELSAKLQELRHYICWFSLNSGNKIEDTIKDITGTCVSNITSDHPDNGEKIGFIVAKAFPEIGD
ncbi:10685_t:CDS:2, partial [Gigaspora margarita]